MITNVKFDWNTHAILVDTTEVIEQERSGTGGFGYAYFGAYIFTGDEGFKSMVGVEQQPEELPEPEVLPTDT